MIGFYQGELEALSSDSEDGDGDSDTIATTPPVVQPVNQLGLLTKRLALYTTAEQQADGAKKRRYGRAVKVTYWC